MAQRKISRAEKAGIKFAKSIIEIAHLFYQKNTKKNFYKGLLDALKKEAAKPE